MNILEALHSLDRRADESEKGQNGEVIRTIIRALINMMMAQERERLELLAELGAQQGKR